MESQTHHFLVADFGIDITFVDRHNGMRLIPSFIPFANADRCGEHLFSMVVDDSLTPAAKEQRERIRTVDTGNGSTTVDRLPDGGYQYVIRDFSDNDTCLLITDKSFSNCRCALNGNYQMRSFGINNALMLAFAFAAAKKHAVLIHASLVRQHGTAYAFIAKSGTGKSTQTSMWLRYLPGCDLINDDNPAIRMIDGKPVAYGGPWSGKTPCYRNVKAPLGAVTRIDRARHNSIERLKPVEAFASVLPAMSAMKWDNDIYDCICDTVTDIIGSTPVYTLHCLPDRESAEMCNSRIAIQNGHRDHT